MSDRPLQNLFSELEELNRKIIQLCCDHRRYADKIPDELNDYMAKAAYTEYVKQHEIHLEKLAATAEAMLYGIKAIADMSTPEKRRRWYWPWSFKRNYATQCADAQFAEYVDQFIDRLLAQNREMKDEFCRSWAKLLQQPSPAAADEAADAPPAAQPAQEPAAEEAAQPAQKPAAEEAAQPVQEPAAEEKWEEWEEQNDAIPDKDITSPTEG